MSLTPNLDFPNEIATDVVKPLKTYKFDLETGEITSMIDGLDAIRQFIAKTLNTMRYNFVIYSNDYGCEVTELLGKGFDSGFTRAEIVRMITEALIYDDRINNVYDFDISFAVDCVDVSFKVDTVEGTLEMKEVYRNE